ncbi:hypothetical protein K437DRAFT_261052 [Tilletiaria anomala UBC 951]|uniref:Uncharacterized protein n=1 Tax=Tilletiaria anomala (strain ATCC 24038 / CBS 436.72 / UBC 951) TaxID=1037660 RepID=A0A066WFX4_TILAU|nr:uncharacterized protein K437DRAFT_261052 [Tilletiaria anomala UBC 951]KDN52837.1 hypothetical protein K437DRAFT_261052 [Tilletiaria anomala UBC 951]
MLLEFFSTNDLGATQHCVGIQICCNINTNSILDDQATCPESILRSFDTLECKVVVPPFMNTQKHMDACETIETEHINPEIVGSLLYLALETQPDLAYRVARAREDSAELAAPALQVAKRIMRYI